VSIKTVTAFFAAGCIIGIGLHIGASRWTPPPAPLVPSMTTASQEIDGDFAYTRVWESGWDTIETLVAQFHSQGWDLSDIDRRYPFGADYAALVTLYFHRHVDAAVVTPSQPSQPASPAPACQDYNPSVPGIQGPFPNAVCVNGGWR
jgi:hypothetical protein